MIISKLSLTVLFSTMMATLIMSPTPIVAGNMRLPSSSSEEFFDLICLAGSKLQRGLGARMNVQLDVDMLQVPAHRVHTHA